MEYSFYKKLVPRDQYQHYGQGLYTGGVTQTPALYLSLDSTISAGTADCRPPTSRLHYQNFLLSTAKPGVDTLRLMQSEHETIHLPSANLARKS